MIKTPNSMRLHIGIFGKTNSGKSSLINAITDQKISIVSDQAGTTTDSVVKAMEIPKLGPVVFIDTPGYDDKTVLGEERVKQTEKVLEKCDIAIFIFSGDLDSDLEFIDKIRAKKTKLIPIVSKSDLGIQDDYKARLEKYKPLYISVKDEASIKELIKYLSDYEIEEETSLTDGLVEEGDLVVLVMPQDIQAPKGRLILPQVQTIRDILDKKALVVCTGIDNFASSLEKLKVKPDLIITDSQCFGEVYKNMPRDCKLTSFSVLFSKFKGDIEYFIESVKVLENLDDGARILIAEACTHPPLEEDIGRVKIPRLLEKVLKKKFQIDFVRGDDFSDIGSYDLIITCGACMFNRKNVLTKVEKAKMAKVPMTNYGITIAYLKGILDKIIY